MQRLTINKLELLLLFFCACATARQLQLTYEGRANCGRFEKAMNLSDCLDSCKTFRLGNETEGCGNSTQQGCFCDVAAGYRRHPTTGACVLEGCCPLKEQFDYECIKKSKLTGSNTEL